MTSLSPSALAYCFCVLLLAYALRGSSGFGSALGMPLLALVIPVKVLAPAWTLLGIASSIAILGRDRAHVARGELMRFIPWCALGIAIGIYWFQALDSNVLAQVLGVVLLGYGAYSFWTTFRPNSPPLVPATLLQPVAATVAGAVGTLFGAMATVFFAIYLNTKRLTKHAFRATLSAMLLSLSVCRAIAYAAVNELGLESLTLFAAALPAMMLGIFIGNAFHARVDEVGFRRLVCVILLLCGGTLVAQGSR